MPDIKNIIKTASKKAPTEDSVNYTIQIGNGYKITATPEDEIAFAANGNGVVTFNLSDLSGEILKTYTTRIENRGLAYLSENLKSLLGSWVEGIECDDDDTKKQLKLAFDSQCNLNKTSAPMWIRDVLITPRFKTNEDALKRVDEGLFQNYMKKLFVKEMGEDTRVIKKNGELTFLVYDGNSWRDGEHHVRNGYNKIVELIPSLFDPLLQDAAKGKAELATSSETAKIKMKYQRVWRAVDEIKTFQRELLREATKKGILTDLLLSATPQKSNDFGKFDDRLIQIDYYDPNKHNLIACKNAVIDTVNGKIYEPFMFPELKYRYPLSYIDCEYRYDEESEVFNHHLKDIFSDNVTPEDQLSEDDRIQRRDELIPYFKRLLGYSLYPNNQENIMVMLVGKVGGNGKSTTINAIKTILGGDECKGIPSSELYPNDGSNRAYPNLSKALQSRIIIFDEFGSDSPDEDSKIFAPYSTPTIKQLTGNDICDNFRPFYREATSQHIVSLPFAVSNTMPRFTSIDSALLRRIVAIPFNHVFKSYGIDTGATKLNQMQMLVNDKDKIFTMMVNELIKYISEGMIKTPKFVTDFQHSLLVKDIHKIFLDECTEKTENKRNGDRVSKKELIDAFILWAKVNEIDIASYQRNQKAVGEDGIARVIASETILKSSELEGIKRALNVGGYETIKPHGKEYVCCRLKPESDIRKIASAKVAACFADIYATPQGVQA